MPIFIAFTFGFYILLYSNPIYDGYVRTFMRIFILMVHGNYEVEDFEFKKDQEEHSRNYSTQIMFVLSLNILTLIVMNVLLAVTVNNTKNVKIRGKIKQCNKRKDDIFISTTISRWYNKIPILRKTLNQGLPILDILRNHNTYKVHYIFKSLLINIAEFQNINGFLNVRFLLHRY